jgi:hypothetical protein
MQTICTSLLFVLLPLVAAAQQPAGLPRWQIGAGASFGIGSRLSLRESDFAYPDLDYSVIPNYTLGLHLTRSIAPDVWLDASVQYARKGYGWLHKNYNGATQELRYRFDYIDFGLCAGFRVPRTKNFFLSIGPVLHFNAGSGSSIRYTDLLGYSSTDEWSGPPDGFRPFAVSMAGSAGFCPEIGRGLRLRTEIILQHMALSAFDRSHPPSYLWSACFGVALLKTL